MRIKLTLWLILVISNFQLYSQSAKILPSNINHPTSNVVYPAVSGDGKVMIFMTDYSDDGSFVMMLSKYRAGKWQNPEDIQVIGSSKVNNWGGYSLNYDGTAIYFSSRRSNGVGKFDIWYSNLRNGEWLVPKNMGKPVNSLDNEGNPSISPDGQRIYFMRCGKMSTSTAEECKIYYSERGRRGWQEAVEMPAHVNRGNTTSPRIMPDNKTLVFASNRPGGQGGIDIWMTKRTGEHWSEPVNIEVVNTSGNNLFLTVTMRSIAFLTTTTEMGKKAIAELRLPKQYRLDNVIIKQGTIKDEEGNNLAAEVRAYNLEEDIYEVRIRTSLAEGSFIMILPDGAHYDVSYNEIRLNKLYHSELVDANGLVAPRREYPNIVLAELKKGLTFSLNVFDFIPYTSEVEKLSSQELSRLARLLKQYPELKIEIGAYQKSYLEDSIPSSEDLSEFRFDTLVVYEQAIRVDTMINEQKDSLLMGINDTLMATVQDTIMANILIDRMAAIDSVEVRKLISVFHNNRTAAQAEAVKTKLIEQGIDESRIIPVGYKDANPPLDFFVDKDRMVVIRFLNKPGN